MHLFSLKRHSLYESFNSRSSILPVFADQELQVSVVNKVEIKGGS